MNKLTSYDILTNYDNKITNQYPNGTWYYANKQNRTHFYIKQNKQLWDRQTRKKWFNNRQEPRSLSSGSNNIL